jgi:PRTRC genetic system ThiF family protein
MQISTEQHYRVALEPASATYITLVGAGGTGSALAVDLARLVYHVRQSGGDIHLRIVDHDRVERKNVGRQQFGAYDVGRNKAESLAERLNLWLGLDIAALPVRFTADTPSNFTRQTKAGARRIVVGAVDNHWARQAMHGHVKQNQYDVWWIDAGNGEFTGQVLVGNKTSGKFVTLNSGFGLVDGLPAPSLQMPGLLEPEETAVAEPAPDCALAVIRDEQSLNVNRFMAVLAAQYVYDMVIRNEVVTMGAYASLRPPSVQNRPITEAALRECGVIKEEEKRGRQKRARG